MVLCVFNGSLLRNLVGGSLAFLLLLRDTYEKKLKIVFFRFDK